MDSFYVVIAACIVISQVALLPIYFFKNYARVGAVISLLMHLPLLVSALFVVVLYPLYIFPVVVSLFNAFRVILSKQKSEYVVSQTWRGQISVAFLSFLAMALSFIEVDFLWLAVASVALAFAGFGLLRTLYVSIRSVYSPQEVSQSEKPTVTLAIPARNETHALTQSLQAALKSDYEKLEILVLDDCSQDKTAQIIRSFAHDGVRFIQGEQPHNGWIGKNQAYQLLARHASGSIIFFCGVDVRLAPNSISQLVKHMGATNADMLAVLPFRRHFDWLASLLQPMRYYRLFALPRLRGVTSLGTAWLIQRNTLSSLGGFESVKSMMNPEDYFASQLSKQGAYRLLISDAQLGITSRKRLQSQIDTATRTLYPQLHRNVLWVVFFVSLLCIYVVAGLSMLLVLLGFIELPLPLLVLSFSWVVLLVTHALIMRHIRPQTWWLSVITLPVALLLQACLILNSMFEYEFGTVSWKGRDVCEPVLSKSAR